MDDFDADHNNADWNAIVRMARAVLAKDDEVRALQFKVAVLEQVQQENREMVLANIGHSQEVIAGLFQVAMTPGVAEALERNREGRHAGDQD